MTELQLAIYEWGEIERECAELAEWSRHGGWAYRFWKWMERYAERKRKALKEMLKGEL